MAWFSTDNQGNIKVKIVGSYEKGVGKILVNKKKVQKISHREKGPGDLVQKKGYGKLGVEKKVGMELLRHTILYEYMFV